LNLQVYSTFENDLNLEMAIVTLEKQGIKKDRIFAVPLENPTEERKLLDSIRHSDGISTIDLGIVLATAFSVIGASVGFELSWGPIYCGIIAAILGFVIGLAIRLYTEKYFRKRKRLAKGKTSEVILIVDCEKTQGDLVESILWDHLAIGIAKILK